MKKILTFSIVAIILATGNLQATNWNVNVGKFQFVVVTPSATDLTVTDAYLASAYLEYGERLPAILTIPNTITFNGNTLTVKKIGNGFVIPNYGAHPTNAEDILELYISEGYEMIDGYFDNCPNMYLVSLPSTLKSIGYYCFNNDLALTSITIPANVETISQSAFSNTGLTSVIIPESVTNLGGYAFDNCVNLTNANIPSTLQTVPAAIFRGTAITSIEIPNAVTEIKNLAFANCTSLQQVKVNWQTPLTNIYSNIFSGVTTANVTLIVPCGTKELYEAANVWKDFIVTEEEGCSINTAIAETGLTPAQVAGYYNLLGKKLDAAPDTGIYIIVYDNGKVEKVLK
ncbi:MAG: leucine-rich repeat domain-containing protein [Prevotellaceae bacterium]|jgi:hypothetical protein|nr:leucine-rich repeat domain-containing protein [Prevotellaceae bacterium]